MFKCAECTIHNGVYLIQTSLLRQQTIVTRAAPYQTRGIDIIDRLRINPFQSRNKIIMNLDVANHRGVMICEIRTRAMTLSAYVGHLLPVNSYKIYFMLFHQCLPKRERNSIRSIIIDIRVIYRRIVTPPDTNIVFGQCILRFSKPVGRPGVQTAELIPI